MVEEEGPLVVVCGRLAGAGLRRLPATAVRFPFLLVLSEYITGAELADTRVCTLLTIPRGFIAMPRGFIAAPEAGTAFFWITSTRFCVALRGATFFSVASITLSSADISASKAASASRGSAICVMCL